MSGRRIMICSLPPPVICLVKGCLPARFHMQLQTSDAAGPIQRRLPLFAAMSELMVTRAYVSLLCR